MLHPAPIAVISIRLEGLDHEGDPSFLVYNAIKPFYPAGTGQASFINLTYNIPDDDGGAGLARYNRDVEQAIKKLSEYVFLPFMHFSHCHDFSHTRFLVFLTTHSTPDTGLLWNVPGSNGAVAVTEVSCPVSAPFGGIQSLHKSYSMHFCLHACCPLLGPTPVPHCFWSHAVASMPNLILDNTYLILPRGKLLRLWRTSADLIHGFKPLCLNLGLHISRTPPQPYRIIPAAPRLGPLHQAAPRPPGKHTSGVGRIRHTLRRGCLCSAGWHL